MKPSIQKLLLAACLASPMLAATSQAAVIQFKGTGTICTYQSDGSCVAPGSVAITATVTYQVLSAAPSGPDSSSGAYSNPSFTQAYQHDNGEVSPWVMSAFTFEWLGGSYVWSALAGADTVGHYAGTDTFSDSSSTTEQVLTVASSGWDKYSGSFDTGGQSTSLSNNAGLNHRSAVAGMLHGLDFSLTTNVADYESGLFFGERFNECIYAANGTSSSCTTSGFYGEFTATSATVLDAGAPQGVPEPGSLLLAGLAGLALTATRHRKALAT